MDGAPASFQFIFNILVALVGALGGYVLSGLRTGQVENRKEIIELAQKVQAIEVIVVGDYLKREEFSETFGKFADHLEKRLDRFENKLDGKADKQ